MLAGIMFNSFSATIAATPVQDATSAAEELWAVVLNGIATRSGEQPTPPAATPATSSRPMWQVTAGGGRCPRQWRTISSRITTLVDTAPADRISLREGTRVCMGGDHG